MSPQRGSIQTSRFRSLLLMAMGIFFVLFLSASGIAKLYTDWWWFQSVGQVDVWSKILGTKIALGAIFSLIFFAVVWINLYLADRVAPPFRALTGEEELIERYHALVGDNVARLRIAVAGAFALIVGLNTAQQWETWLLFRNGGDFGVDDPLFGIDAGFYVFRLPFWTFLVGWVFGTLIFALLLTLVAHYLNGGIRASAPKDRVSGAVKLHVSVLLALLAVTRAVAYFLDRFQLVNAQRGRYDGALATDVQVQLPALNLLAIISLFGAGLFIANIRRKGWGLPAVALAVWLVSHIVVGNMLPGLYQRFRVEVEESAREKGFIGENIAATRFAYGLDESKLRSETFEYSPGLTSADVAENQEVVDDISILDRELADASFKRVEGEVQAFDFAEVLDVDRYDVGGNLEPVVLGVRELDLSSFNSWESSHVAHTHGYGVAVASADEDNDGLPQFLVSGVGSDQRLGEGFEGQLTQPQIYYDEGFTGYAVVGATRDEVDYPHTPEVAFRYDGAGGVKVDSIFRKTMFALRFQEYQLMISPFLGSDAKVIYNRDIHLRVRELAPFLDFDSDPYPVLADGQVFWVMDAYTTTNQFPYSQQVQTDSFTRGADLRSGFNYVRNSVKVVVDAYNGDVAFYVIDDEDPIVSAYQKAFPDLFTPGDEAPAALAEHFRYPTDLFKVQTDMWGRYQVDDPIQFLEGALAWQIARAPDKGVGTRTDSAAVQATPSTQARPMEPQYRTTKLPGSDQTEFVLQRAFEPRSETAANARPELRSVLVARSDAPHYGELVQYLLPVGQVLSPELVDAAIRSDSDSVVPGSDAKGVSGYITLQDSRGSSVLFGEMQLVMVGDTVLYVRPLYVKADSETAPPKLTRVIVFNGSEVAMGLDLDGAIASLSGGSVPAVSTDPVDPGDDSDPGIDPSDVDLDGLSVAELIGLADLWLGEADKAEAAGEIETAAELRTRARQALDKLGDVLGIEPSSPIKDSGDA